jgi:hypothetical protein
MTHWECPCGHARSKSLNGVKPRGRWSRCASCAARSAVTRTSRITSGPPLQSEGGSAGYPQPAAASTSAIEGYWDADAHAAVLAREQRERKRL